MNRGDRAPLKELTGAGRDPFLHVPKGHAQYSSLWVTWSGLYVDWSLWQQNGGQICEVQTRASGVVVQVAQILAEGASCVKDGPRAAGMIEWRAFRTLWLETVVGKGGEKLHSQVRPPLTVPGHSWQSKGSLHGRYFFFSVALCFSL